MEYIDEFTEFSEELAEAYKKASKLKRPFEKIWVIRTPCQKNPYVRLENVENEKHS